MRIVLASGSPRRKELMKMAGYTFDVAVSGADESFDESLSPEEATKYLSKIKARDVLAKVDDDCIVIGADTVVAADNKILGKPKDKSDAYRMLKMLSGRTHQVYTGVYVVSKDRENSFVQCTDVTFYPLTDNEILDYIETGEPMDKAGAYGIQGRGGLLCEKFSGDYFNIVGLPIARLKRVLDDFF